MPSADDRNFSKAVLLVLSYADAVLAAVRPKPPVKGRVRNCLASRSRCTIRTSRDLSHKEAPTERETFAGCARRSRSGRPNEALLIRVVMTKPRLRSILARAAGLALAALLTPDAALAAQPSAAPSFWDPALRLERPDLSGVRAIRFLTADDYPPLNFDLADGTLAGFNVEIARAVCEELEIGCTIQARRFDTLIDSPTTGKGDAVIASIAATPVTRAQVDFSIPYYQTPARFVGRKGITPAVASVKALAGKTVGIVAGSSHEAYLTAFPRRSRSPSRTPWPSNRPSRPARSTPPSPTG